ncbi:MAG: ATP-binding protein [Thermoplasmata archaeon]|nr:ATP-binding protein [Thermoplasmata archaeon]
MDEDKRREHFYDTVARLVSKIRLTLNPSDAFGVISDEVRELTGASYAVVFLVDEDSQYVRAAGISGVDASKIGALPTVHIDEAFRRSVAGRSGSAPLRYDTLESMPEVVKPLAKAVEAASALVCPIILRGEFQGYIAVANRSDSPGFSADAEEILPSIAGAVGILLENLRMNIRLEAAKQQTDRILTHAPIGIFICDQKGIFKSVNRQMLLILDRESEGELIGTSVFELPLIARSGLDALLMQGMEGHDGEKADVHVVARSDKALYLHVKVTSLKSERGDIDAILFVAMDVTSKIRLQNQLERSYEKLTQTYQELERVTKMKTQFIDVVSHELRTPLTVMRGYIDLVESEYSSKLDPKFSSRLKIIKTNTDKLYALVENMLDVSRLEKGSLQIHLEPLRIDAILEEIIQTRVHDAEEKKQSLTLEVEGRLPLIMADRRRIKDVFNSLVDNAIKYTQDGGRIQVSSRDEGRMIHVWVKDNGVGIPLENLGKIFDRFHIVASNDLSHQVNRLGLGLPIAKGIVEAHGGRVWVESQVGKGSVFHVDLPKEQPK